MKRRINVLSVPLLAAVLFLTGCENPLEPPPPDPGPAGSYVAVQIEAPGSAAARTVYPALPSITKCELSFSGPEICEPVTLNTGGPHLIALIPGSWTITATAFTGTEGAYSAIARGSAAATVSLGKTAAVNITLAPISGEAGTFRYAVALPAGAEGRLVIATAEGGTVSDGTIYLQSGALSSGTLALPTGQYLMNISLSLGDRRAGRTEALHIYPYRESAVEYRFFEHDFRLVGDLAHNRWEEKTLSPGEVHWHKFDADGETMYRVQWNGAAPQGDGTKSLPVSVSAYTGDNSFIFENKTSGWVSPEEVSGIDGILYLRVQGANSTDSGSYALRYYRPAELPPQEGINLSINALPVPAISLSWNTVPGAAGYRLYRTTDPAVGYNPIGGDLTTPLYTDAAVYGGMTYYYRVSAYSALGEGEQSPAVSAAPPLAAVLSEKVWAGETLGVGETKWHTFTADEAMTYLVQWNGASPQGDGTKTLPALVSAYTSSGGSIFEDKTEGWTDPETLSGLEGIVSLKVEGVGGGAGTFAIRYFDPATTPPLSLAAPVISGAGDGTLGASWEAVPWATAYEVWTGTSNNTAAAVKYEDDVSEPGVTVGGLANGTVYYVWVKAKNSGGTGGFSPATSGKPIGSMGDVSLAVADGQLGASWAAVAGADQYEVYYSTVEAMPDTPAQTVTGTLATISDLVNGTTYYVWVKANNENGTSSASPATSGKPIGNMGAVSLAAVDGQLTASWTAVAGADSYEVYYSTDATIPENPAQTVDAATATITGLVNGTTYYLWVKAKNETGTSSASPAASGKPIGSMGTVTLAVADGQLGASWAAVAGADQYEVYYSTAEAVPDTPAQTVTTTWAAITERFDGTPYNVWVRPKNVWGMGSASAPVRVIPATGVSLNKSAVTIFESYVETLTATVSPSNASNPTVTWTSNNPAVATVSAGTVRAIGAGTAEISAVSVDGGITAACTVTVLLTARLYVGSAVNPESSVNTLGGAFTWLNANAASNTAYTIVVYQDVSLSARTLDYSGKTNVGLTIKGNSAGRSVQLSDTGSLFTVNSGVTLAVENLVLRGRRNTSGVSNTGSLIRVNGGSLEMHQDSLITENYNTSSSYSGGGVYVSSGTFTMQGNASVSGNTAASSSSYSGGGVYVSSNGTFTMQDSASVSGNTAASSSPYGYSGGVCVYYGTFTMQDSASVSGNTVSSSSSNIYGGGVSVYFGTFTMQDNASVSGNTVSSSSYSYGGGVCVYYGTFTMQDSASVSDNSVSGSVSYGGGVYVNSSGTFTMQDNASISNNRASGYAPYYISYGGGVYVSDGTFTKKGGTIYGDTDTTHTTGSTENTATSGNGHAVYLNGGKQRNSDADTTVNLYAKYTDGAWTYNDASAGGAGDTTANWE